MTGGEGTVGDDYFRGIYATGDDPWGYRTRWYEARKRRLAAACLPDRAYDSGFEPGRPKTYCRPLASHHAMASGRA